MATEKRVDDVEDVKAFVAAAAEQIENPLTGAVVARRKTREMANSNLVKFHATPLTKDLVHDADANLARIRDLEAKKRDELTHAETSRYVFFLACRRHMHHGLYFTCNPKHLSQVTDKDWYAGGYKEVDNTNGMGHWREHPYCQVCYAETNVRELLPIDWVDQNRGTWMPDRRWVYMIANNEEDFERDGKRAIRIFEQPYELANRHFDDLAEARENYDRRKAEERREKLVASAVSVRDSAEAQAANFAKDLLVTKKQKVGA